MGDRGVDGRPPAFCSGTYFRWYYVLNNTRDVAAQTSSGEPAVPGIIPGGVAPRPITGRSGSNPERGAGCSRDDSRWCSVKKTLLFITSHRLLVYTRVDLIHTSGLAEASVSTVCTLQSSGCGGVCGFGAWPTVVLVAGGSPAGWHHQCPIPWVAWIDDRGQQTPAAQRLSSAACLGGRHGAATGTQSQASLLQLPQPLYGD